jgi:hypothetical protein
MKTIEHKNMQIEDFLHFYATLNKQHPEILGAEYDKETEILKVFYQDGATELSTEELKTLKIPSLLTFRKTIAQPKLDSAIVVSATENEFIVETFDTEAARAEVKRKLTEFEEVK